MAAIIVGHKTPDVDSLASMYALQVCLMQSYSGEIRTVFLGNESTYRNIEVHPYHDYEQVGPNRVYHVDCGGGSLDHHRVDSDADSSLQLIVWKFRMLDFAPEWEQIVKWVNKADRGELEGGMTLPQIIRGWVKDSVDNQVMFDITKLALDGLLANERTKLAIAKLKLTKLSSRLVIPDPTSEPGLYTIPVEKVRIGLGYATDTDQLGSMRYRLRNCHIMITFDQSTGDVSIWSESNCLREIDVVQRIRIAEAKLRDIYDETIDYGVAGHVDGMAWFALEVDSVVKGLMSGSPKVWVEPDDRTRIHWKAIVKIIIQCFS